jgi:hypothetical protein
MAGMATVARILTGMAEAAALCDLSLLHCSSDGELDICGVGQGV